LRFIRFPLAFQAGLHGAYETLALGALIATGAPAWRFRARASCAWVSGTACSEEAVEPGQFDRSASAAM
jgi:hypothetical protein